MVIHKHLYFTKTTQADINLKIRQRNTNTMPGFSLKFGYEAIHPPHGYTIEGLHVTLQQANFASHHTRERHIGFLCTRNGIGKDNKIFCYFLFN